MTRCQRRSAAPVASCGSEQAATRERYHASERCYRTLRAPSTAEFPGCGWSIGEYEIRGNRDKTVFSVVGYVDAQNSFGAKLRNRFAVSLKKAKSGDDLTGWSVAKVAIAP
jgi:hypothetical protein